MVEAAGAENLARNRMPGSVDGDNNLDDNSSQCHLQLNHQHHDVVHRTLKGHMAALP
jgi:hypothetical protein